MIHCQGELSVEAVTCSRKQEPRLTRVSATCADTGADGRTDDLSQLVKISVGWMIQENFVEQIGLCHDEKMFATIWTNHTLHGQSINFRDMDPGRPSFR